MPKEVTSGEDATKIVEAFLRKRSLFPRPIRAVRENDHWLVEVDVGFLDRKVATLKVDARTGKIDEYTISPN